ncbi:MAG: ABC transporter ATP-binding protein [Oscillospiraceae bacterium]|jgi:oligopeptide/dipeptide ABC transporter ATP-binding protein|nr:ABC transporter ATP-binding protein [Oscillospiraceae bacterium]
MKKNVLEVNDLQVEFRIGGRYVPAVSEITFSIPAGATLGIVGESGCGKTVTASTIMRLLPKKKSRVGSGSIRLNGTELLGLSDKAINKARGGEVSMIFQEPMTSLNPVHTVGAQLREMLYAHEGRKTDAAGRTRRLTRAEADAVCVGMLTQVGIPAPGQRMREYPHQLSGGMRQRVMIAMALICKPSLLIADEPTTALDVTIQAQILDLMRELQRDTGASIMLITHDMGVIAGSSDYVAVMYAGHVVEYGDVRSIFKSPKHPYTFGLLKAVPRVDEDFPRLYTIQGLVPTLEEMPPGCRFAGRCAYACPICERENPGSVPVDGGTVRCWFYREDAAEDIRASRARFISDALTGKADAGEGQ